jgi:pyridoxamine 5'-phosphate oxidase
MTRERDERFNERLRTVRSFEGELPDFDVDGAPEHPAELFMEWLEAAIDAGVHEPHVMNLATVDADGRPSARSLILRRLDDGRWSFGTSRTSRKGAELAATPWAAATFYWSPLGRQVRLRGRVLDAGPEAAADDFLARPAGARIAALASRQSEVLASPSDLEGALAEAEERVADDPQALAEHWTVFHLVPDEVEFFQADPERRHVRLRYALRDGRWQRERLWP